MGESSAAELVCLKLGVRDLKCHAERERHGSEVGEARGTAIVEGDSAVLARVVEVPITKRVDGVDQQWSCSGSS